MLSAVDNQRSRTRRSQPGRAKSEITVETVRKEINKTLNSLMRTPQAFCSPKEKVCMQGPPGIQDLKDHVAEEDRGDSRERKDHEVTQGSQGCTENRDPLDHLVKKEKREKEVLRDLGDSPVQKEILENQFHFHQS